jgi:hypothetical protein
VQAEGRLRIEQVLRLKYTQMGRKSSSKAQVRVTSHGGTPTPPASPGLPKGVIAAVIVAVVAVGAFAFRANNHDAAPAAATPAAADQATATGDARWARFGPHKQANLPPMPVQSYAPPRPMNVVREAYLFAAEHPEILSYVPCFCGCERGGHKGNHDCFVAARDDKGDVTAWEPHGLDCTVCIDVATEARQMFTSGASVRDIRAAVEKKWAGFNGGHTPTPAAPPKAE